MVQDVGVDICVLSETWLTEGLAQKQMDKVFGSEFIWFGRERKVRKRASGGVGILGRKSVGVFSVVKASTNFEVLWVKMSRGTDYYFIGAVYIPPDRSQRETAKQVLDELEVDIHQFRKQGKVILMGDFNCRVGSEESVIKAKDKQLLLSRTTADSKEDRGKFLISSMNAAQMVVMNGLDSGREFTFLSTSKLKSQGSKQKIKERKSVIDYIILSDSIIAPDTDNSQPHYEDQESGTTQNCYDFPENTLYIRQSTKILTDYKYHVSDHFMVTCKIKAEPFFQTEIIAKPQGKKLDIIKWDRRDHGDPAYWTKMQISLEKNLAKWDLDFESNGDDIDSLVSSFVFHINEALTESLRIRSKQNSKLLSWPSDVVEESILYKSWRSSTQENKEQCQLLLSKAKKKLRYTKRKAERARNKRIIQE